MWILLNGKTVIATDTTPAFTFDSTSQHVCTHWNLAAGEFVEVQVRHSAGISLDVMAIGGDSPEFSVVKTP